MQQQQQQEQQQQNTPNFVVSEQLLNTPFPTRRLSTEEIISTVEDILARPAEERARYAIQNYNDFVLLHPHLFKTVTSATDDFDVSYLRRMLKLVSDSSVNVQDTTRVIGKELADKYGVTKVLSQYQK